MRSIRSNRAALSCLAALALVVGLAACGGAGATAPEEPAAVPDGGNDPNDRPPPPPAPPPPSEDDGTLVGGFLLLLEQEGESFYVRIVNPPAVETMAAIVAGRLTFQSVSGPIRVNGPNVTAAYAPWSWHIDPYAVRVNQLPTNGLGFFGPPSQVEANLQALVAAGREKSAALPNVIVRVIYDLRGTVGGPTQPPEPPLPR